MHKRIVFISSYYSAFKHAKTFAEISGMPAVYKFFEYNLKAGKQITWLVSEKAVNHKVNFPVGSVLVQSFHWYKLREIKNSLVIVDRANLNKAFWIRLFGFSVGIRIHGVSNFNDKLNVFWWRLRLLPGLLALRNEQIRVVFTIDGSPIDRFISNTRTNSYMKRINGVDIPTQTVNNQRPHKIVWIGRDSKDKGVDILELFINQVSHLYDITVIGLDRNIENVRNLGRIPHDKVLRILSNTAILLSTNRLGNLCNTVLEAVSCGCKIMTLPEDTLTGRDEETMLALNPVFRIGIKPKTISEEIQKCISDQRKQKLVLKSWEEVVCLETNFFEWHDSDS